MKKSFMLAAAGLMTIAMSIPMALASTTNLHPAVTKSSRNTSTITYHVQSGDTLWKISQLSAMTIGQLEADNPTVNQNVLSIGEPIQIPTVKAAAVILTAKKYLGKVHYVYGGTTPAGFDCSGFVQYMFAKDGVTLPRTVKQMALMGVPVSKNNLKKGDLIFFAGTNGSEPGLTHIGIYVANGWFIEQSSDYNNIIMARLWGNPFYKDHFAEARRLTSVVQ